MSSGPAIIRRAVVFPQPDGPTRTSSSPSPISSERSFTASKPFGYRFVSLSRVISATGGSLAFQRAGHQAAHEVAAEEDVDDKRRKRGEQRSRHLQVVRRHERACGVVERDSHRPLRRVVDDEYGEEE